LTRYSDTVKLKVISQKLITGCPQAPLTPCSSVASLSSRDNSRPAKKLRIIGTEKISQALALPASTAAIAELNSDAPSSHSDLSQSEDVCGTISQKASTLELPTASVLYIDYATGFRYILGYRTDRWPSLGTSNQNSLPLHAILQQTVTNSLSIPDQLKLALTLARGMLLFNTSP
jgi:hypothetical protein